MDHIPTGVRLSSYSGGASDITRADLQRYVSMVEAGSLTIPTGPVWSFEQLPAAHQAMDDNRANGKMVVLVD
jgi:NADPH:quinone reductase-like Zn-dependent oxidoreductase